LKVLEDSLSHISPEYKNKKNEKRKKSGHIVHGLQHDHQLSPQRRHKPYELEDTQQTKRSQDRYRLSTRGLAFNLIRLHGQNLIHTYEDNTAVK
jgi:hypothetical protein